MMQTTIARDLSINTEVNMMVRVMSLHQMAQMMVIEELSLSGKTRISTELGRGDEEKRQEKKVVTQLCDSTHAHRATSQIVQRAVVYIITLTG